MKPTIIEGCLSVIKGIFFFFTPALWLVFGVAMVSLIDTYYGIKKARKQGVVPTSRGFRKGYVPKVGGYSAVILLTYFLDHFLLNEFTANYASIPFVSTKIIAIIFIANEVQSIDENWQVIKGYSFLKKLYSLITKVKDIKNKVQDGE
jgi:hypothetical protein